MDVDRILKTIGLTLAAVIAVLLGAILVVTIETLITQLIFSEELQVIGGLIIALVVPIGLMGFLIYKAVGPTENQKPAITEGEE